MHTICDNDIKVDVIIKYGSFLFFYFIFYLQNNKNGCKRKYKCLKDLNNALPMKRQI